MSTANFFQKELKIYFGISGRDSVTRRLVYRYWDKVSTELKDKVKRIEEEAPKKFNDLLTSLLRTRSKIFEKIPKDDTWLTGSLIVPFEAKKGK